MPVLEVEVVLSEYTTSGALAGSPVRCTRPEPSWLRRGGTVPSDTAGDAPCTGTTDVSNCPYNIFRTTADITNSWDSMYGNLQVCVLSGCACVVRVLCVCCAHVLSTAR